MRQPEWGLRPFEKTGLLSELSDRKKDILVLLRLGDAPLFSFTLVSETGQGR